MENFLANEWKFQNREKRSPRNGLISLDAAEVEAWYQNENLDGEQPDVLFERKWAKAVMNRVMSRIEDEYSAVGEEARFQSLMAVSSGASALKYAEVADDLGMSLAGFKSALRRFRLRCRELLRIEVASLVDDPRDIDDEIAHVVELLK